MKAFKNGLTSESIGEWIVANKKLHKILSKIEKSTNSIEKQAEKIFHRVSKLYGIPKYPEDVDDEKPINGHIVNLSLYEQIGFLKYLEPEPEKLAINTITAIFFIVNGNEVDLSFVYEKYKSKGGNKNEISGFGFRNEDVKVELVFVKKGESWFDLGCKYFTKTVDII